MNVPKLRFPEFSGEWEEKKIRDYAECRAGATPDTKNNAYWDNGTISWMSSGEVNNKFIYFTEKKITRLGYEKTSTQLLPINTVVIALAGQGKTRGTVAITRTELCTNQSLCGILNSTELNSEYLFQFLSSQYKQLRASSTGGDESRGGLNLQIIGNFRLPYTSLPEQQKIADFLSTVDSIIASETKILNALQKKKKALMQKLFSQQLRFKADDGSEFSEWEEKKLGDCVEKVCVGFVGVCEQYYTDNSGIPMYRTGNLKKGKVVKEDLKYVTKEFHEKNIKSQLKLNDILMARHGENGQASLYNFPEDANCLNIVIVRPDDSIALHDYLMYCINSDYIRKEVSKKSAGSTQSVINTKAIEVLNIPVPTKEEQQKIADCLSSLDNLIQNQQKIVTNWQQRKKGLLQQMFI